MKDTSTISRTRRASMIGAAGLLAIVFMAGAAVMDFPIQVRGDYTIKLHDNDGRDRGTITVRRNSINGSLRGNDRKRFSTDLNRSIQDGKKVQTRTGVGDIQSNSDGRGSIVVELTFAKKRRGVIKVRGNFDVMWNNGQRDRGKVTGQSSF